MLSQERVISLLYEKTFPMTSAEMHSAEDINDLNNLEMQQQMDNLEGDGDEEYDPEEYALMQQEMLMKHHGGFVEQVDEAMEMEENMQDNYTDGLDSAAQDNTVPM